MTYYDKAKYYILGMFTGIAIAIISLSLDGFFS